MAVDLRGKVIVISGGTKGVGATMAGACAKAGAKVVIGGRDAACATPEVLFVHTDVRNVDDCTGLFDAAYGQFGRIDGFFNYAGITPVSSLDTCDEDTFDAVMDVNFKAAFFCCQSAVKYMRLNKGAGGSIVLTGSTHAWGGQKDRAAYACSKGALRILTEHISKNYAAEHIRCNYLVLGWTPTEGELALRASQGVTEAELRRRAAGALPMGRMCEPEDYVDGVLYMLSDASAMMTGSIVRINAGEYI